MFAQAPPGVFPSELVAFCQQLIETGHRANALAEKHYKASTRRRMRRVVGSVARSYAPRSVARGYAPTPVLASADRSAFPRQGLPDFPDLGDIKDFGKKSLKKLKKVVGGAVKFVPQVRVLRCAVFAALGGAAGYIKRSDMREVLVDAGLGCIASLFADFLPDGKKKR